MGESSNPLLEAALAYARLGLPVFPCAPSRKAPRTDSGFHDATSDQEVIRRWWRANPRANVGMPTGAVSGLIVLDIDPRHDGVAGFEDLQRRHEPLPETAESLTGDGGRHLFLRHPGDHVPCTQGKLAPGVDVKGDGGYVLLPPSVHPSGDAYAWSQAIEDAPPIACPAWLAELVCRDAPQPASNTASDDGNPIPEGQRNTALARLAGGMRRHGMSRVEIAAALQVTNRARCQPPLPEAEVERIAASVSRYAPDEVAVALVEDHYQQMYAAPDGERPPGEASHPVNPGPLPEELIRIPGFVSELMDYCLEIAPYPNTVMAFSGALALQAVLAGRKVRDPGDNRTNLYLLGLAHSSAGKEKPRAINTEILHAVGLSNCLGGRFASGEGMQDALFASPCMLFQTDEIDSMLQSINKARDARHENIMSTLLMMYSSANSIFPMRRKAGKESPGAIDQPCLILLGTAIPKHYYQALSERMLTNGFFARMVILECGDRSPGQEPRIEPIPERILETAKWWAEFRPGNGNLERWHPVPEIVPHTEEARSILIETRLEAEAEYAEAEKADDPVGTTVWGRVSEQARKLALLYAVSENHRSAQITEQAARWASQLVLHQARRMLFMAADHVAENPFHAECLKLMRKLRESPDRQMGRNKLMRAMRCKLADFDQIVGTLLAQGDIVPVEIPTKTKPAQGYRLP